MNDKPGSEQAHGPNGHKRGGGRKAREERKKADERKSAGGREVRQVRQVRRVRRSHVSKRPEGLAFVSFCDPAALDRTVIEGAADTLLNGGVIALPTDTVYGIAADAVNARAVARLYQLKGRHEKQAIPLLIGDMKMLRHISPIDEDEALALLNMFWPGPLTAVLPKYSGTLMAVSRTATIGVRIPNHAVTLAIIRALHRPLAVTSANLSGHPPATDAEQIRRAFGERLDLIVDSGPAPGPIASTVLDVTARPYRVLREGPITRAQLIECLGEEALVND